MLVEVIAVVGVLGFMAVAYLLLDARKSAQEARQDARAHAADATVQRARATQYKKVLETWGEDVIELERQIESASGGKVGPALDRLHTRLRSLRKDKGGGKAGGGGESS